jgi:cardiolipin synthase C
LRGPAAALLPALLLALAAASACSPPRPPLDRAHEPAATALATPEATTLGRLFAPAPGEEGATGRSGLALLASARDAFVARQALAAMAERTLDLQYYLWEDDTSGRLLLKAVLAAADRGVRVRLLLDDLRAGGRDSDLALLDAHPRVEVRLFNPFADRTLRVADVALDFARITHRMHNKAFVADNAVAVAGGRNVGDHYFAVNDQTNFRDLDLLAAGPVVRELSASFDDFWNSRWSVPVRRFARAGAGPGGLGPRLDAADREDDALPFDTDLGPGELADLARSWRRRLVWAEAAVVADRPDKPETARPFLLERLRAALSGSLRGDLLIESAYFIPGEEGTARLCGLVARGVRVRVLTNSLASNDVLLAHSGYAKYRLPLLRCGVELFELRPDARFARREWTWLSGRSRANLHTKAVVVDRAVAVVGSLNLDPRSANLNTEIAVVAESPALADEVADFVEAGMRPENAYRLEPDPGGEGGLAWVADEGGRTVRLTREPGAGRVRAVVARLLALLPIEGQL